jgi:dihydroorotate dehydrogenase electron transfer subunit
LSIHQRDGHNIAFLFTVAGKGTAWLSQQQAGDNIDILGPLGNGFSIHPTSHNLLLVAGGIGIAPVVFLTQEISQKNCEVVTLVGARTAGQIDLEGHLPDGIRLIYVAEDGGLLKRGLVTEFVPDYFAWADQIFACGPTAMYRDMALKKGELGLEGKPVQISLEMRLGCGRGVCYACTVRTKNGLKQVCQDGPVFDLDDIIWDEFTQA